MGNIKSLDWAAETLVYEIDGADFTLSYADIAQSGAAAKKWDALSALGGPFDTKFGPTAADFDGEYLILRCGSAAVSVEVGGDVRYEAHSFVAAARAELAS